MRALRRAGILAAFAAAAPALPALAQGAADAEPRPLIFSAGEDRYEVARDGFESLDYRQESGLELCMTESVQRDITAFTEAHLGEVVRIAIGEVEVFAVEVAAPFAGGCIDWPLHPMVAANYVSMLTGEAPRMPLPPESTGE